MSYKSFNEDLTVEEINKLDDSLNIPYEHPARTDFLHLARIVHHMCMQHIYDDLDIPTEVVDALMNLVDALFIEEIPEYFDSTEQFSLDDSDLQIDMDFDDESMDQ